MKASGKNEMNKFTGKGLPGSFRNAFSGIRVLVNSENNARIHIFILLLVVIAGIILKISPAHWLAVVLAAGLVLVTECLNTAVEYLSDAIMPEYNPKIKKAKDLAAAGVLVSAIASFVTGLIVFIPALLRFFDS